MPHEVFTPDTAGMEVIIPQSKYLNVEIQPMKGEAQFETPVIVLVPSTSDKGAVFMDYLLRTTVAKGRSAPVPVRARMVEPSFSVTYNKTQGSTIERVVLVLNGLSKSRLGAMTLEKLYVAVSRVTDGAHIA